MRDERIPFRPWAAALAFALLLMAGASAAQDDWLKRGRDILGGAPESDSAPTAPAAAPQQASLTEGEKSGGLKDALRVGTERVVDQIARPGGFADDPAIHIGLPGNIQSARLGLAAIGMSGMLDDLEAKMNEAAELATGKARVLFTDAITAMTVDDAQRLLTGGDDSVTRYFQGKMSAPLTREMTPVVSESLSQVGAVQQYESLMGQIRSLPLSRGSDWDLTAYVVEKGMDGIFHYLAIQEKEIRQNPAARSTALMQKVFSSY